MLLGLIGLGRLSLRLSSFLDHLGLIRRRGLFGLGSRLALTGIVHRLGSALSSLGLGISIGVGLSTIGFGLRVLIGDGLPLEELILRVARPDDSIALLGRLSLRLLNRSIVLVRLGLRFRLLLRGRLRPIPCVRLSVRLSVSLGVSVIGIRIGR